VLGGLGLAFIGAIAGWQWFCLAGLVVSAAAESRLHSRQRVLTRALRATSMGLTARILLRLLAAAGLLAHRPVDDSVVAVGMSCAAVMVAARALHVVLSGRLRVHRRPAIETRNVPLAHAEIPPPPKWAVGHTVGSMVATCELLVAAAMCAATTWWQAALLGGLGALGMLGMAIACEAATRRVGKRLGSPAMVDTVQKFLDDYQPEVVLYSGDTHNAAFHIKMWLTTFERLDQRCVIVLRDRRMVGRIGTTRLPVLCVPSGQTLMSLELSSVKAAFYVVNVGNNIHLQRVLNIKSVFIGHGDSDKRASFSPVSKTYHQVWVAGRAGRERYLEADVGVADRDIVEVGRPQLDRSSAPVRHDRHVPTVLYAPTWEGWDGAQEYGSVASHGVALAAAALRPESGVRFMYRPHPFTGRRDADVAEAHRQIVSMIREANERAGWGEQQPFSVVVDNPLSGITDAAMRAVVSGQTPDPIGAVHVEALRSAAEEEFWTSVDPARHQVLGQGGPSLMSCFDQADILVTDVSSVLSDYQGTGRPFAVCNTSELSAGDFLVASPSARAGLILPPNHDFAEVIALAKGEVPDVHVAARQQLREHLLGPAEPPAQTRFQAAVDALVGVRVNA
jgi:hypothetical protein